MATAAEYVMLLGVSLLIFTAVSIGFTGFGNTASGDATAEAAYRVAAHVSRQISDVSGGGASVTQRIDLPERICGHGYVVFPSGDGKAICVLVGGRVYDAPVIALAGARVKGFMISLPAEHSLCYDACSATVTMV